MNKLRIIPLGGMEGVTKNMYIYEYWNEGKITDIILVDCGVGFIAELEQLGVDSVIPDVSYLADKKHLIRALFITHGHEDHIGAIPFIISEIGKPAIIAPKLAALLIKEKLAEEHLDDVSLSYAKFRHDYTFGAFKIRYIHMTHSIPDTTHLVISTPAGTVYHGSDFKMDLTPVYGNPPDFAEIVRAAEGGVTLLLSDGLGSEREGYTLSESTVGKTFDDEMADTKGRFFMSTFASNISRIRQCVDAAIKYNRKICFVGSSMKRNTAIAIAEGYMRLKPFQMTDEFSLHKERPNHVCIILTGSQGEFGSALEKIASDRHRTIKIQKGDRILFSSDPIPGNDPHIDDVIESLIEKGADVVYTAIRDQLHASGHGSQEDLKLLARLVHARFVCPIGTTVKHSKAYQQLMAQLGYSEKDVPVLHSGVPIVIDQKGYHLEERIPLKEILIDGTSIGDVGSSVLKERETLGREGVLVIAIDGNDIAMQSKGFMFDDSNVREDVERAVKRALAKGGDKQAEVITQVASYLNSIHQRSPLIIPLVIKA